MEEYDYAYDDYLSVGEDESDVEGRVCASIASSLHSKLTFASSDELFPIESYPEDVQTEGEICDRVFSGVDYSTRPPLIISSAVDSDSGWTSGCESNFPQSLASCTESECC